MNFMLGDAEQFCRHVLRAFDSDKNGLIGFKEFLYAIHITSTGTAEERLGLAFR
jgi:Ca2+-binding EF-hand superfamily protein